MGKKIQNNLLVSKYSKRRKIFMSESDNSEKIKYRIQLAESTLSEANVIKALNRYYYACFYAVTALLLTQELNPKTHSGVRTLFSLHFVQTGLLPFEFGQFYGQLFDKRLRSDYDDYLDADQETVDNFSDTAIEFIDKIKKIILLN
jgi:uncharacterized protein (UPF0332 family)